MSLRRKQRSVQLKYVLLLAGGVIFACCALIAVSFLTQALNIHRQAHFEADEMSRYGLVLAAVNAISAERGPSNNAMTGEGEAVLTALKKKRVRTDKLLAEMSAAFPVELEQGRPDFAPFALLMANVRSSRVTVDRVVMLPKNEREPEMIVNAISALIQCADSAFALRDRLGSRILTKVPALAAGMGFVNDATTLREMTGRLGSYTVMMLANPEADDRQKPNAAHARSEISLVWTNLRTYGVSYLNSESVKRAVLAVEVEYFNRSLPFLLDVIRKAGDGEVTAAKAFTDLYVPGLKAAESLRDEITRITIQRASERAESAHRTLDIGVTSLVVICLLIVGFALITSRFLIRPLFRARDQILMLSNEDFDGIAPQKTMSRELQEMFDAITILHRHMEDRRQLEKEQARLTETLRFLSERDPLTHLLNRRAVEDIAARCLREADESHRPLAVMIVDLDHFKRINDTFGHATGDLVLKKTAERMTRLLRSGDHIARFGGEEFLVILDLAASKRAAEVAERVRRGLAAMVIDHDPVVTVTASIGVAVRQPRSSQTWNDLVALADTRLYRAKERGRNNVCSNDEDQSAYSPIAKLAG